MGGDSRVHTSDDADSRLGMNVRTLREQKGMPQAALARAMTQQGWQWHQSTVARIESGRQPLRLAEASALAQILGETVDRLTWTGPEIDEAGLVDRAASFLRMQFEETADEVAGLIAARHRAEHTLAQCQNSPYKRVQDSCGMLAEYVDSYTLKHAMNEGTARSEKGMRGYETDPQPAYKLMTTRPQPHRSHPAQTADTTRTPGIT